MNVPMYLALSRATKSDDSSSEQSVSDAEDLDPLCDYLVNDDYASPETTDSSTQDAVTDVAEEEITDKKADKDLSSLHRKRSSQAKKESTKPPKCNTSKRKRARRKTKKDDWQQRHQDLTYLKQRAQPEKLKLKVKSPVCSTILEFNRPCPTNCYMVACYGKIFNAVFKEISDNEPSINVSNLVVDYITDKKGNGMYEVFINDDKADDTRIDRICDEIGLRCVNMLTYQSIQNLDMKDIHVLDPVAYLPEYQCAVRLEKLPDELVNSKVIKTRISKDKARAETSVWDKKQTVADSRYKSRFGPIISRINNQLSANRRSSPRKQSKDQNSCATDDNSSKVESPITFTCKASLNLGPGLELSSPDAINEKFVNDGIPLSNSYGMSVREKKTELVSDFGKTIEVKKEVITNPSLEFVSTPCDNDYIYPPQSSDSTAGELGPYDSLHQPGNFTSIKPHPPSEGIHMINVCDIKKEVDEDEVMNEIFMKDNMRLADLKCGTSAKGKHVMSPTSLHEEIQCLQKKATSSGIAQNMYYTGTPYSARDISCLLQKYQPPSSPHQPRDAVQSRVPINTAVILKSIRKSVSKKKEADQEECQSWIVRPNGELIKNAHDGKKIKRKKITRGTSLKRLDGPGTFPGYMKKNAN